MTKRNLFIIIAILVVLDIAAGFWYLAGHVNSDGKSDLFSREDEATEMADTISIDGMADKFKDLERYAYFVSLQPAVPGHYRTYWSSVKQFKSRIPVSVNGNGSLSALMSELSRKAFGFSDASIENGLSVFLKEPKFNTFENVAYKSIARHPDREAAQYENVQSLCIYPIFSSSCFLVMVVDKTNRSGDEHTHVVHYVNYDRVAHKVLAKDEVFDLSQEMGVLECINKSIDKQGKWKRAAKVPAEFYLRRNGIFFIFPEGELSPAAATGVFVFYKNLESYLTPFFKKMIKNNGEYKEYTPITF